MPARSVESSPGHRVLVFTCEVCGAPACESRNANIREALRTGDVRRAGQWYCAAHVPAEPTISGEKYSDPILATGGDMLGRVA